MMADVKNINASTVEVFYILCNLRADKSYNKNFGTIFARRVLAIFVISPKVWHSDCSTDEMSFYK